MGARLLIRFERAQNGLERLAWDLGIPYREHRALVMQIDEVTDAPHKRLAAVALHYLVRLDINEGTHAGGFLVVGRALRLAGLMAGMWNPTARKDGDDGRGQSGDKAVH